MAFAFSSDDFTFAGPAPKLYPKQNRKLKRSRTQPAPSPPLTPAQRAERILRKLPITPSDPFVAENLRDHSTRVGAHSHPDNATLAASIEAEQDEQGQPKRRRWWESRRSGDEDRSGQPSAVPSREKWLGDDDPEEIPKPALDTRRRPERPAPPEQRASPSLPTPAPVELGKQKATVSLDSQAMRLSSAPVDNPTVAADISRPSFSHSEGRAEPKGVCVAAPAQRSGRTYHSAPGLAENSSPTNFPKPAARTSPPAPTLEKPVVSAKVVTAIPDAHAHGVSDSTPLNRVTSPQVVAVDASTLAVSAVSGQSLAGGTGWLSAAAEHTSTSSHIMHMKISTCFLLERVMLKTFEGLVAVRAGSRLQHVEAAFESEAVLSETKERDWVPYGVPVFIEDMRFSPTPLQHIRRPMPEHLRRKEPEPGQRVKSRRRKAPRFEELFVRPNAVFRVDGMQLLLHLLQAEVSPEIYRILDTTPAAARVAFQTAEGALEAVKRGKIEIFGSAVEVVGLSKSSFWRSLRRAEKSRVKAVEKASQESRQEKRAARRQHEFENYVNSAL
eukprot:RCo012526